MVQEKAEWSIVRQQVEAGLPETERTLGRRKAESPARHGGETGRQKVQMEER